MDLPSMTLKNANTEQFVINTLVKELSVSRTIIILAHQKFSG